MLRALGSASCDITHETGETSCYGHWSLHLEISHTGQGVPFVAGIRPLHLKISLTRHGVQFVTGIVFCILRYHTRNKGYDLLRALGSACCDITRETGGTILYVHWALQFVISHHETGSTICDGHWVLHLVISHTRHRVRFVAGIGSASTICYRHWVLNLVISYTRQGVRFVAGIGFCILRYHTRDRRYDV